MKFDYTFGCELHQAKLIGDLKNITITILLNEFCKNINNILSGKTKTANNTIEEAFLEFREKKKFIGKHGTKENNN